MLLFGAGCAGPRLPFLVIAPHPMPFLRCNVAAVGLLCLPAPNGDINLRTKRSYEGDPIGIGGQPAPLLKCSLAATEYMHHRFVPLYFLQNAKIVSHRMDGTGAATSGSCTCALHTLPLLPTIRAVSMDLPSPLPFPLPHPPRYVNYSNHRWRKDDFSKEPRCVALYTEYGPALPKGWGGRVASRL